jgi:Fe-S oxidoreductase
VRVGLFIPCFIDAFFPEVGVATLELLERFGCEEVYPRDQQIPELIALCARISRMRAHSSSRVVACADEIIRVTIDTFAAPNKTVSQFDELVKTEARFEPLRNVSKAAREELGISALLPNLAANQ